MKSRPSLIKFCFREASFLNKLLSFVFIIFITMLLFATSLTFYMQYLQGFHKTIITKLCKTYCRFCSLSHFDEINSHFCLLIKCYYVYYSFYFLHTIRSSPDYLPCTLVKSFAFASVFQGDISSAFSLIWVPLFLTTITRNGELTVCVFL